MRSCAVVLALALFGCTAARREVSTAPPRKLTLAYTGDVWGEVGPCG